MVDLTYNIERTFHLSHLPDGEYIVTISILDPAARVPRVRFANINYFNGGYTALGIVGVGQNSSAFNLSGFDDLATGRSLYYPPSNK
ncbi:MAG: hypothetical protein WC239_06890 [Sphaerochaetaceae bacterium]